MHLNKPLCGIVFNISPYPAQSFSFFFFFFHQVYHILWHIFFKLTLFSSQLSSEYLLKLLAILFFLRSSVVYVHTNFQLYFIDFGFVPVFFLIIFFFHWKSALLRITFTSHPIFERWFCTSLELNWINCCWFGSIKSLRLFSKRQMNEVFILNYEVWIFYTVKFRMVTSLTGHWNLMKYEYWSSCSNTRFLHGLRQQIGRIQRIINVLIWFNKQIWVR